MTDREFFDLLDDAPRTPTGLLVRTAQGETRTFPIAAARRAAMTTMRRPRLEARMARLALLTELLAGEEART